MITFDTMKEILNKISDDLIGREEELCKLDAIAGDGDHGTTVRKAFTNIKEYIVRDNPADISSLFMTAAMAVSEAMGGAIGPIFSSIFMGLGMNTMGKTELGTSDIATMFRAGLDSVQQIGGAKVGDKTLVDALSPMVDALEANTDKSEKEAMTIAAEKALEGAQGTKDLVSKKGRSHFLGENSVGYVDAGSMTMAYFAKSFADNL